MHPHSNSLAELLFRKSLSRISLSIIFALIALALILYTNILSGFCAEIPDPMPEHIVDGNFDYAFDVSTADIDGDGDIDILGAARNINEIAWWENDGTPADGGWIEHTVAGDFDGAIAVHTADLDGDGDVDILGAALTADDVAWWENAAGDGSAWIEHTIAGDFLGAFAVHAADLDRDGDLDVLGAALNADDIAWWENTAGDGSSWTEHSVTDTFNGASDIFAADIDCDGDQDILGTARDADDLTWWENDGYPQDGGWVEHTVEGNFDGAIAVHTADLDRDGDLDVLGAALNDNNITWWENTVGASSWVEHSVADTFNGASDIFAADIDSDGDQDILGTARDADDLTWWENDGSPLDGGWVEHTVAGDFDGAIAVHTADLDGDGDQDILGAAAYGDEITWWENKTIHRSATYPTEANVDDSFEGVSGLSVSDVDSDGDEDIIGVSNGSDDVAWWENLYGDGSAWTEHTVDPFFQGAIAVQTADLDGDGDVDILGAAPGADDVTWWENAAGDGSAWIDRTVDGSFNGAAAVHAADLDGDGDVDILGAAAVDDNITWWENDGYPQDGGWVEHTVEGNFDGARSVHAIDLDSDGDQDILGTARNADDVTWWENDGSPLDGGWVEHTVAGDFDGATTILAVDLDGDGDQDLLGTAYFVIEVTWWENDGSPVDGGWIEHTIPGDLIESYAIYAADVDSDGDYDVLGASHYAGDITWWENDGSPADGGWIAHPVTVEFDGARSVFAADVNGDGDLDVLGAAEYADEIAWWENRGGQFALSTTDTAPPSMNTGTLDDILQIEITHRGRSGDSDLELVTLELLFDGCYGDSCTPANLTTSQANELFDDLRIYKDSSSGVFESGTDLLVATVDALVLTSGVQTVIFSDGDANVQVAYDTPQTYFVVVDRVDSVPGTPTVDRFTITHITEASSTAEDRSHDIGLTLEYATNATSSQVVVEGGTHKIYLPIILRE
jgi:hypothetical protein